MSSKGCPYKNSYITFILAICFSFKWKDRCLGVTYLRIVHWLLCHAQINVEQYIIQTGIPSSWATAANFILKLAIYTKREYLCFLPFIMTFQISRCATLKNFGTINNLYNTNDTRFLISYTIRTPARSIKVPPAYQTFLQKDLFLNVLLHLLCMSIASSGSFTMETWLSLCIPFWIYKFWSTAQITIPWRSAIYQAHILLLMKIVFFRFYIPYNQLSQS